MMIDVDNVCGVCFLCVCMCMCECVSLTKNQCLHVGVLAYMALCRFVLVWVGLGLFYMVCDGLSWFGIVWVGSPQQDHWQVARPNGFIMHTQN